MLIKDLQTCIKNENIPHILVLFGEEGAVRDIYVEKVLGVLTGKASIFRCSSVLECTGIVGSRDLKNRSRVILVRNDNEFLKEEKAWQKVFNVFENTDNYLILCYVNIDKRGKFYKRYSNSIIQFEKLGSPVILRHVNYLGIPEYKLKRFIEMCDCNYGIILKECDKITTYAKAKNISNEEAFDKLVENNLIYTVIGDITFKFTDSILTRDKPIILYLLKQAKEINESPILTMSILYNEFRNILMIQGLGKDTRDASKRTGLTPFQCKMAREKSGHYSIDELVNILKVIQEHEMGVKLGLYNMETVIEDLLVHIL